MRQCGGPDIRQCVRYEETPLIRHPPFRTFGLFLVVLVLVACGTDARPADATQPASTYVAGQQNTPTASATPSPSTARATQAPSTPTALATPPPSAPSSACRGGHYDPRGDDRRSTDFPAIRVGILPHSRSFYAFHIGILPHSSSLPDAPCGCGIRRPLWARTSRNTRRVRHADAGRADSRY